MEHCAKKAKMIDKMIVTLTQLDSYNEKYQIYVKNCYNTFMMNIFFNSFKNYLSHSI